MEFIILGLELRKYDCSQNEELLKRNLDALEEIYDIATDIDTMTANFTEQIFKAMELSNITKIVNKCNTISKPWYDRECYHMKNTTKSSLKKYTNSAEEQDRKKYIEDRKKHLKLLKTKRDKYNKDKIKNARDPKSFWSALSILRKKVTLYKGLVYLLQETAK
ncbi:ATR [Cordylochernes scorpioides]|uniref:ATR n=1 Tax=Cordylochernes scorpioides TaxID=51811 RepID=A0ABY6LQM0_9ARAC|nr:ATR [Cordylochernes scorpioides]